MNSSIKTEVYEIECGRDEVDGLLRWVTIRKEGLLHSPSDAHPAHELYDEQGRMMRIAWFSANMYHRISGPALVVFDVDSGVPIYEEYRRQGALHRDLPYPAVIKRDPKTGHTMDRQYYVGGTLQSDPSSQELTPNN